MNKLFNITSIAVVAFFLRCFFMVGFALGDDYTYGKYAYMITQGMYPPLCDLCVFAFRPVLIVPLGLSLSALGWSEFNFVLPVLVSSLISIYLIYGLGVMLFDKQTGLAAASCLAIFPLDLVHATTVSNDIMLSMLVALSMLLFLRGCMKEGKNVTLCCIGAGCILGSTTGVKLNALPLVGLFAVIALYYKRKGKQWRKATFLFLMSWLAVQLFFGTAYYLLTGNFWAQIKVELNFDKMFNPSCFVNTPGQITNALLYYPRLMLALAPEGHPGYTFYPYGFFYPVFLLGAIYAACTRDRSAVIPLLWFTYAFLIMEFFPLRISPHYQPIHRLARFLALTSIPALLITAYFLKQLYASCLWGKCFSTLLIAGLVITSLHQAYRKSSFYNDCMSDAREVYTAIRQMPHTQVISDYEMKEALIFHDRYSSYDAFKCFEYDNPSFLPGSLVILGGSRRPDVSPLYAGQFVERYLPQANWLKVYEIAGRRRVWRTDNLVIYRILGE